MAMKEYAITVPNGMDTTVLMSDDDAKRAGLLSDTGTVNKAADPAKQPDLTAAQKAEAASKAEAEAKNKQANPENKSG